MRFEDNRCHELFAQLNAEIVCDRYSLYDELRRRPPQWIDEVQAVVVSRFADVERVLRDQETFASSQVTGPLSAAAVDDAMAALAADSAEARWLMSKAQFMTQFLLAADGHDHIRRRMLVPTALTRKRVQKLENAIRAIADRLIGRFLLSGNVEFVAEFATPMPVEVMAYCLGVEDDALRASRSGQWAVDLSAPRRITRPSRDLMMRLLRSQDEFIGYFLPLVKARRYRPRDDLLQHLVDARSDDSRLSDQEILEMCAEILVAGTPTTASLLTSTVALLAKDPKLFRDVSLDLRQIPALIDESLRLESPIQAFYRTLLKAASLVVFTSAPIPPFCACRERQIVTLISSLIRLKSTSPVPTAQRMSHSVLATTRVWGRCSAVPKYVSALR